MLTELNYCTTNALHIHYTHWLQVKGGPNCYRMTGLSFKNDKTKFFSTCIAKSVSLLLFEQGINYNRSRAYFLNITRMIKMILLWSAFNC